MDALIGIGLILLTGGVLLYRDIQDEQYWKRVEVYGRTHRHCVNRPYKLPRHLYHVQ